MHFPRGSGEWSDQGLGGAPRDPGVGELLGDPQGQAHHSLALGCQHGLPKASQCPLAASCSDGVGLWPCAPAPFLQSGKRGAGMPWAVAGQGHAPGREEALKARLGAAQGQGSWRERAAPFRAGPHHLLERDDPSREAWASCPLPLSYPHPHQAGAAARLTGREQPHP